MQRAAQIGDGGLDLAVLASTLLYPRQTLSTKVCAQILAARVQAQRNAS